MNKGKTIFSQIMSLIPERDFKACVDRYKGNYRARNFSCKDQFLVMSYAQLTGRDSLRDIENCRSALSNKLNELFNKTVPKEKCDDSLYPSLFDYEDF